MGIDAPAMTNKLLIAATFLPCFFCAQDSINRLQLFDITSCVDLMVAETGHKRDLFFDAQHVDPTLSTFPFLSERSQNTSGGELFVTFRVRPNAQKPGRLKMRIGAAYQFRTFFSEIYWDRQSYPVDTLAFADPSIPPHIIDSTSHSRVQLESTSELYRLTAGIQYDVFTFRYFNFYTGCIVQQGIGLNQISTVSKYTSYTVERYPDQEKGRSGIVENQKVISTNGTLHISRVSIPIGIQHRFSNRTRFSPGIFIELSPSFESLWIKGRSSTSFTYNLSFGLRLSFRKHRDS